MLKKPALLFLISAGIYGSFIEAFLEINNDINPQAIIGELSAAFDADAQLFESWNADLNIALCELRAKDQERYALFALIEQGVIQLKEQLAICQADVDSAMLLASLKQLKKQYCQVTQERNEFLCRLEQLWDRLYTQLAVTNGQARDLVVLVDEEDALAEYDSFADDTFNSSTDCFASGMDSFASCADMADADLCDDDSSEFIY